MKSIMLCIFVLLCTLQLQSQASFDNNTNQLTIDFDSNLSNVNNGTFTGSGLESAPNSGRLDGDAWNITGMSDGSHTFGQTSVSGDFARGNSSGGVSTGGLYAFTVSNNNNALGLQPTGSDITPGTITLKINNNKTSSIFAFDIDYNIKARNDQNRSSSLNFSFSFDNSTFTDVTSVNYTSPTTSDTNPVWTTSNKSINISSISIPPGQSFYIRWTTSDVAGSGSRDEISIDDIIITATANNNNCTEPASQPTNLTYSNITSNSISGDFNYTVADNFLIVQTTTSGLTTLPNDGTTYSPGNALGNGTIIDYNNTLSFTSLGLQPLTTYYYHIFSANDNCTGGPDYKTDSPLTGNTQTTDDSNSDYYNGMDGLTCETLKTALHLLIDNHTQASYNYLWTLYQTTDDRTNDAGNQTIVWDMYSDNPTGAENEFVFVTNQCGTYSNEGDCYNREHSFPKSWWGGATSGPQYTDAFHVVPVDGYINGIRSNLPYSEVQSGTETYVSANGSLRGSSSISIPGYSGSVFEPIDAFKGDLARNYFYMATRYENLIAGWETSTTASDAVLSGTSFEVFEPWFLSMLITWHNNDPVTTKEIERNDAIFDYQGNRNPFIDHPEYVDLIWGSGCSSDIEAPTDPSNLIASNITENSLDLNWTASTDNISVDHYNVYQDGIFITTTSSSNYTVTGLNALTSYNFYVNAEDAAGNISGNSNTENATTQASQDMQAPTDPSNLIASNIAENSLDLNWTSSTDNVGVNHYNVYQDGVFITTTASNNYAVSGLNASTSYSFYVNAEDASGNISGNSNIENATTQTPPDTQAPTVPTALASASVTETSIDLLWNNSTDNVGVSHYNIYQDGSFLTSTSNNIYTVSGLSSGTTYDFYVTAEDAAGNVSSNSNILTETTSSPSGPTIVHEGYFESGWDGWIDGGSDCARYTGGTHSYEGNDAIRIRDNSGNSSTMTSPTFDLTSFNDVEFNFYFKAVSMENNENFIISYDNGSGWVVLADYARGTDFNNNTFYNVSLLLDDATYNFSANSKFKIQCDASGNNDKIYIDQVVITGTGSSSAPLFINDEEFALDTPSHIPEISILKDNTTQDELSTENSSIKATDINIYPNPVVDILNIEIKDLNKIQSISIYDLNGKKVQNINHEKSSIDVSNLMSGQYIILIVNEEAELVTKRFIKL